MWAMNPIVAMSYGDPALIAAIDFGNAPLIGVESTTILTPNRLSYSLPALRSTACDSVEVSEFRKRIVVLP